MTSKILRDVYSDESHSTGHRYLVLSALTIECRNREQVVRDLVAVREAHMTLGEFKWSKVSQAKLQVYKEFVDVFFDAAMSGLMEIHMLVVDQAVMNHKKFNGGDKEIGFNKLIYQLLANRIGRIYGRNCDINCYLDHRTTKHSPAELQVIVNNGISKQWGYVPPPFKRIHFLDSKKSLALQLNDVIMGAVAAMINNTEKQIISSVPKLELARHIVTRSGCSSLMQDTQRAKCDFSIWHFRGRK